MFSRSDLYKLIIPLIIEQLLAVTIGMADTIMVSSVGEVAVSAVSLVDTINILLINVFAALATGGAIVATHYIGCKDLKSACIAAKQLLLVTIGMSSIIMIICLIGRTHILSAIFGNVESGVMANAKIYFLISAVSYPFIALYNVGAALFRSMGNSKVSMFTSLFMNLINISGNALLIFVFKMGVAGAATATLVSRIIGAIIITVLLKNKEHTIHYISIFKLDFQPTMIKNILKIGIPNGLENGMFQIGKILVQGLIASFGTIAIAANAVGNSVAALPQIPGQAIGLALITVVGQCVGAKDYVQAKKYMLKFTGIAYLAMGVLNIIVLLMVNPIVSVYSLSPETAVIAKELLIYHSICCLLIWPISFTLPNGLRAANDVKYTMTISIISMWVFRIGLSYYISIALEMGVLGVWIAMTIDWLFRTIAFTVRFLNGKWKTKQLI